MSRARSAAVPPRRDITANGSGGAIDIVSDYLRLYNAFPRSVVNKIPTAVVLDLDCTVLYTFHVPPPGLRDGPPMHTLLRENMYFLSIGDETRSAENVHCFHMHGFRRPFVTPLLRFLHESFETLVVWTAGTLAYANEIVPMVFAGSGVYPQMVLASDTLSAVILEELGPEPVQLKDLRRMLPLLQNHYPMDRVILVDDNPDHLPNENVLSLPQFQLPEHILVGTPEFLRIWLYDDQLLRLARWVVENRNLLSTQRIPRIIAKIPKITIPDNGQYHALPLNVAPHPSRSGAMIAAQNAFPEAFASMAASGAQHAPPVGSNGNWNVEESLEFIAENTA